MSDITNFPNGLSSWGVPVLPTGLPVGGNVFFFNPAAANNGDGLSPATAFNDFVTAYAALTANQNDILFYMADSSGATLTAAVTWDKDYTHLIGLGAPTRVATRARFFAGSALTASPFWTISASGCIFHNIYIFQGVASASAKINVSVTGQRNHFSHVHFAGGGHATGAIDGACSLKVDGGAENEFINCTMGVDTAEATSGYSAILFDGSATRNWFENCIIQAYPAAAQTGVALVELADTSAVDRWTEFKDCRFFSNSTNKAVALASAFVIPAGHTTTATIFISGNSRLLGATDWDASDRAILYLDQGVQTGGGNSMISLVSAAT